MLGFELRFIRDVPFCLAMIEKMVSCFPALGKRDNVLDYFSHFLTTSGVFHQTTV